MPRKSFITRFAAGGVNQSVNAALLDPSQLRDAVNCQIRDGMICNRPGVVIHDLPELDGRAIQGMIFYNPILGQSQQLFGSDAASLVLAAGGRKYHIKPTDDSTSKSKLAIVDVTGEGLASNPDYHMVWMIQAENYVIAQDGNGNTWIWDGQTPAFDSTGYNSEDKPNSKLANGASMLAYAHGRVIQSIGENRILIGDIIHKGNLSSPENILDTTEQTYWATGSYFSPPSGMGEVQAMAILPLQNTQHGHGDLLIHCKNGIFSLDVSIYPREDWINQAITKHVVLDASAGGFYAVETFDGDQIFLGRHGVQTIRSEAAVNSIGDPFAPISEPVRDYIRGDNRNMLRFASVSKVVDQRRLLVTTGHMVDNSRARGGRGMLSLNLKPDSSNQPQAWEGLWTLPGESYLIGNIARGLFGQDERVFFACTGHDGQPRIAELSKDLDYDILADGTEKPIEWQVLTRVDTLGDETTRKDITGGVITFRNVREKLEFEVFCKTDSTDWTFWTKGCLDAGSDCCLGPNNSLDYRFDMGVPVADQRKCLGLQLALRLTGVGCLESIRITSERDNGGENRPSREVCIPLYQPEDTANMFNPFSYSDAD